MKKLLFIPLIVILVFSVSYYLITYQDQKNNIVFNESVSLSEYTVLVYMIGADLEFFHHSASDNLSEMIKVPLLSNVNLVIETGGGYNNPEGSLINFTTVKRFIVENQTFNQIADLGSIDMASPETLSDFLIWGIDAYPAKKYGVILWDHGFGAHGYGLDMISGGKFTVNQLGESFEKAKDVNSDVKFEFIGYDACLMNTIEVADAMKEYGKYMIGSEEIEPGWGWNYTAITSSLNNNPVQDGKQLGMVIADSYKEKSIFMSTGNDHGNQDKLITLSVLDLSKIESLQNVLNLFSKKLIDEFGSESLGVISKSFGQSEKYGVEENPPPLQVDLEDFVYHIGLSAPEVKLESEKVIENIKDVVVYNVKGESRANSNGLSIFVNMTTPVDLDVTKYDGDEWNLLNKYYVNYLLHNKTTSIIHAEIADDKITGYYEGGNIASFSILISETPSEKGILEILSIKEFDPIEFLDGKFDIDWDESIPALCNSETCTSANGNSFFHGSSVMSYIPVKINSTNTTFQADLIYDMSSGNSTFIGAWVDNEDELVFSKLVLPLNNGDIISTYTWILDTTLGTYQYVENEAIVVDADFGLVSNILQDDYVITLEVCDFSKNCAYTSIYENHNLSR